MSWVRLELELPARRVAEAEALLGLLGAASVTLAPAGGEDIFEPEPGSTPLWERTRVRALFPPGLDLARATRVLGQTLGPELEIETAPLANAEWEEVLTAAPRRLLIGARLAITSAQDRAEEPDRIVVRLNRGLGFGTGEHPTTRLCLDWLEAELAPGVRVVDYGCGSGILAVTALCLGAARAWAVDVEPQALAAARANAGLNRVGARLWVGRPEALPTETAEVVLANILADPLIALAPRLAPLAGESGTLVLTGILPEQLPAVAEAYRARFGTLERREHDGWVAIVAAEPRH